MYCGVFFKKVEITYHSRLFPYLYGNEYEYERTGHASLPHAHTHTPKNLPIFTSWNIGQTLTKQNWFFQILDGKLRNQSFNSKSLFS